MKIIGLTGGIATGKSIVAGFFRQSGLPVIDADQISRKVVEPGSSTLEQIVDKFGKEVLLKDGALNRALVRRIVFDSPEKLKQLNEIIHPVVIAEAQMRLNKLKASGEQLVILEVPLLFETGYQTRVNQTILVYATQIQQIQRITKRDGCGEEQAKKIISAQMPIEEKKKLANYIIDNSGSIEETKRQVKELVEKI